MQSRTLVAGLLATWWWAQDGQAAAVGDDICINNAVSWYTDSVGETPCRTYERLRQLCNTSYVTPTMSNTIPPDRCTDPFSACCCNSIAWDLVMLCVNCQLGGGTSDDPGGIAASDGGYFAYLNNCPSPQNGSLDLTVQQAVCRQSVPLPAYLYQLPFSWYDTGAWTYGYVEEQATLLINAGKNVSTECSSISSALTVTFPTSSSSQGGTSSAAASLSSSSLSSTTSSSMGPSGASGSKNDSALAGAIAGGVIGGLIALISLVVLFFFCYRRYTRRNKRNKAESAEMGEPLPIPTPIPTPTPTPTPARTPAGSRRDALSRHLSSRVAAVGDSLGELAPWRKRVSTPVTGLKFQSTPFEYTARSSRPVSRPAPIPVNPMSFTTVGPSIEPSRTDFSHTPPSSPPANVANQNLTPAAAVAAAATDRRSRNRRRPSGGQTQAQPRALPRRTHTTPAVGAGRDEGEGGLHLPLAADGIGAGMTALAAYVRETASKRKKPSGSSLEVAYAPSQPSDVATKSSKSTPPDANSLAQTTASPPLDPVLPHGAPMVPLPPVPPLPTPLPPSAAKGKGKAREGDDNDNTGAKAPKTDSTPSDPESPLEPIRHSVIRRFDPKGMVRPVPAPAGPRAASPQSASFATQSSPFAATFAQTRGPTATGTKGPAGPPPVSFDVGSKPMDSSSFGEGRLSIGDVVGYGIGSGEENQKKTEEAAGDELPGYVEPVEGAPPRDVKRLKGVKFVVND